MRKTADLVTADVTALATKTPLLLSAPYDIDADCVVKSPVVWAGGRLNIRSNQRVSLEGGMIAPEVQVFDYSDRSSRAYVRNSSVAAGWWGLDSRDGARKDNNIPLQYALDSVAGSLFDPTYANQWEGGVITIPQGYCYMQGGVINHGFTTIRGSGRGTIFCPDEIGWTGVDNYLFKFHKVNPSGGNVSQFNARLENCRIRGGSFAGVEHQVLAWSPQEQSGWYNVHFDSVYKYGLTYQYGYGGAAMIHIQQCEFWFGENANPNGKLINFDMNGASSVGWMTATISGITVAGLSGVGNERIGIYASGRVVIKVVDSLHAEGLVYGVLLNSAACLSGGVIQGGPDVSQLISVDSWARGTAFIDAVTRKGNATKLFKDWGTGQSISTDVPYGQLKVT